jgi:hypothetical protein
MGKSYVNFKQAHACAAEAAEEIFREELPTAATNRNISDERSRKRRRGAGGCEVTGKNG